MRATLVAVTAAAVLTACAGSGGSPGAPPSGGASGAAPTSAAVTAPPVAADVAVKAALRKTRAAKTGTFVVTGSTEIVQGTVTVRRAGSYDLGAARAALTQTFHADPPDLLVAITGKKDARVENLVMRTVLTARRSYLQMPAWKPPANKRWLAFTGDDIERLTGVPAELESAVFPSLLDMLAYATPVPDATPGAAARPDVVHVRVPGRYVLGALPSSSLRKMIAGGLDVEKLTEQVDVEVRLADGLISSLRFDAIAAFVEAAEAIGQSGASNQIFGLKTSIEVSDPGKPVRIVVPAPSQVMTKAEFERTAR